jgi:hypothetical protein
VVLEGNTETLVQACSPAPFSLCLVEPVALTHPLQDVALMDGLSSSYESESNHLVPVLLTNHGHLSVKIEGGTTIGTADQTPPDAFPLPSVLSTHFPPPTSHPTQHINKIDLSSIPVAYRSEYKALLTKF